MTRLLYIILSLAVLLIIIVLAEMNGVWDQALFMQFLEKNVSPDGKINNPEGQYLKVLVLNFKITGFCLLGLFLLKKTGITSPETGLLTYISLTLFVLISVFTVDQRVFFAHYFGEYYEPIRDFLFKEDHLMENLTVVFLFLASIHFFRSAREARKKILNQKVVWGFLIMSGYCMLMMMEEISWGQRIFGWETPELIREMNYQQEINFHNYLNPVLDHIADGFSIFLAFILIYSSKLKSRTQVLWIRGLLPETKYFYPAIIILISALADLPNEILEELISLIFLFYSIDVWKFLSQYRPEKRQVAISQT